MEDVYDLLTDMWIILDEQYNQLLVLKETSPPKVWSCKVNFEYITMELEA